MSDYYHLVYNMANNLSWAAPFSEKLYTGMKQDYQDSSVTVENEEDLDYTAPLPAPNAWTWNIPVIGRVQVHQKYFLEII